MKHILMLAKYSHDLTYFKNVKNYAESRNIPNIKIDILFNFPIFFIELFLFFIPTKLTKEEIADALISEINRKVIKYSPIKARLYAILFVLLARLYFLKYKRILKSGGYTTLCVWGGYNVGQKMAILAAEKMDINVFHFENGVLPNTTVMDLKGTNFNNSVPRNYEFYKNIKPNFVPSSLVPRVSKQIKGQKIILPKKFIFCPFQVALDTQILVHSKWIKTMDDFYFLLEKVARHTEEDLIFVIKEHPNCYKDYPHLHNKNNPKIIFANENITEELIKNSEMVITINSTVGIEGMIYNKKVVTLGNAFYSGYGFAKNISNENDLIDCIKNREKWIVNAEDNLKFLSYLQNFYHIEGSWKNPDTKHLEAIIQRLIKH